MRMLAWEDEFGRSASSFSKSGPLSWKKSKETRYPSRSKEKKLLSRIDINKQVGYLIGLCLSLIFYKTMDLFFEITDKKVQITILHYLLLTLQIFVIYLLIKSFKK